MLYDDPRRNIITGEYVYIGYMTKRKTYKKHSKTSKKGGNCGCSGTASVQQVQPYVKGGYNSGLAEIPPASVIPYNQSIGSSSDPFSNLSENYTSTRLLSAPYSGGKGKGKGKRTTQKKIKGGSENIQMNEDQQGYVFDQVKYQIKGGKKGKRGTKGGAKRGTRKTKGKKGKRGTKGKRRTKTYKGGNLSYTILNQNTNPITGLGNVEGSYTAASLMTGNSNPGDLATYNQPVASAYGGHNPYVV